MDCALLFNIFSILYNEINKISYDSEQYFRVTEGCFFFIFPMSIQGAIVDKWFVSCLWRYAIVRPSQYSFANEFQPNKILNVLQID